MDDRTGSQEDLVFSGIGGSDWRDWRNWNNRRKLCIGLSILLTFSLLITIVSVAVVKSGGTPAPLVPTTTVAPAPTNGTTTTAPTTTTTPATTTTATTTTTPTTTTSATTTTTPATTTTATTTTTPTTTTSATTTTTPATTTSPTTTTTPATTTSATTTTTPATTTTSSTTTQNPVTTTPFTPVTIKPIPKDWSNISAVNLLKEVGIIANYTNIPCKMVHTPVWKWNVTIDGHSWSGESDTTKHAKVLAARAACKELFNLTWTHPIIPPPDHPCGE